MSFLLNAVTRAISLSLPLISWTLLGTISELQPCFAAEKPYIPVGEARAKKITLSFARIKAQDETLESHGKSIYETVSNDLLFMDTFKFSDAKVDLSSNKSNETNPETGPDFLIDSKISRQPGQPGQPGNSLRLETRLIDPKSTKEVFSKAYLSSTSQVKAVAHQMANDIVHSLTGLPGIFLTKIAMSCDKSGKKEIYLMNYDGTEVKQVTHHRSLAFGPAWNTDGSRLSYSLFTRHRNNLKNIDLFEFNFLTNSIRLLSNRKGINSGPAYSPDGSKIAVTMSFGGNPELYILNPLNLMVNKITHSFGVDVDPSWSPDGKSISFVSTRTGASMIFKMNSDGSQVQRLTYAGKYNATPSWSPQNNKIAFAGWLDQQFDIFIMNPDGSTIERLTKGQGNNEDPYFSPDGNFVVFSSNRTGQKNIYVMNIDGSFVRRLTYGLGNCVSPKWSFPPKLHELR